ncbi:lipopolysaccharide biosynthesis protein [Xaviernesmea oryzae]|uniref:Membrane protein involved in the export of O-antigen and teichoic acid n=1 Tax=Xaviernesmea oryzae TaxID=464029 RepID=A0A1X7FU66_9HYPH|nr:oligosaccharide flippase family protein [Xaviernesmea oryzae]SMF58899.1 Membrane protein involved in the export of O-antigen and teichoic acid [Xaviernesmea oryzae]
MLLKSTLIYGPAILLTRISALLFLVIATRLIDKTEYGLLTLVVTVGEMTDVAVTNWLRISLLRLGGKGDVTRGSLARAGNILICTTLLALVIAVVASSLVVPERWADFSIAVCAYLVAGAIARYALVILQMQQRHSTYAMLEFLRALLQLVFPVATLLVQHNSFLSISLASSFGTLTAGMVAGIVASRRVISGPPRFTHREFFALGVPIVVMALVSFGLANAERVFLKVYHDATAVAVFAAAYALARQPVDMIANAINMGAFPEAVARFDEEGPAAIAALLKQFLALIFTLSLPVAALLAALGHDLTELLLPASYDGPYNLLFAIIACSAVCTNLADFVYGAVVYAHKRPWLLIISKFSGSTATIVLSFLLIPRMVEVGAALALAGGAIVNLLVSMLISERLTPVPLPWRALAVSLGISASVGVAAALVSGYLGDLHVIFRLAAAGFVAGIAFLGLNALCYPQEARHSLGIVRSRLQQFG